MEIMPSNELPQWLKYPPEYLRLIDQKILEFEPWYILNSNFARSRYDGLRKRYPNRRLFAFAARQDNDDIACWDADKPGSVLIIHDFASEGRADRQEFASFWNWFRAAIEDMIDWE